MSTSSLPLQAMLAAEIRAELGRQRSNGAELGRRIGHSKSWVSDRLNCDTPLTIDQLADIADALQLSVVELMARAMNNRRPRRSR